MNDPASVILFTKEALTMRELCKKSAMIRSSILFILLFGLSIPVLAQHSSNDLHESNLEKEHTVRHFRIAALIGHTFVPAGQSQEYLVIPSWGLDLEYWFNQTWGIGLHNDLEIQEFIIEKEQDEFLERDYPLVLTLDALYKPWRGLVFQAGAGYEIEKTEDFFLARAGIEYEFEIGNHWDVSPMFFYDYRFEANDTWSLGLGIGKRF